MHSHAHRKIPDLALRWSKRIFCKHLNYYKAPLHAQPRPADDPWSGFAEIVAEGKAAYNIAFAHIGAWPANFNILSLLYISYGVDRSLIVF